ncbi:NUDIX hydrolase [Mycolicibacterium arenosum]|uniref:NUDIX domain-containing protein n=1 Tax=Mycolicibacterium arenosum TaxID=2952157 RepID=A0ABT1M9M4_9MYCO|nr:NUDIX domain-containing protein [Mycolicibacterium sp. CAU 1645]MCP9275866.1 NUDIX domain-containing protein [Mycolicibacterium sp. CAU 1645]
MLQVLLGRLLSPRVVRLIVYWTSTRFTAGSLVVWVVDNRVLLVRNGYGERAWGFPGGVMNRSEDPVDCAVRELREETGIDVAAEELTLLGTHTQRAARHIDHVYRLDRIADDGPDAVATGRFEIAEIQWWPLDALPVLRREADDVVDRYLFPTA